jgi:hypothetical protein
MNIATGKWTEAAGTSWTAQNALSGLGNSDQNKSRNAVKSGNQSLAGFTEVGTEARLMFDGD